MSVQKRLRLRAQLSRIPAALALASAGCSHALPLSDAQADAISPQAVSFIESASYKTIPSFVPISADQMIEGRRKFNANEAPIEDALIAKYDLNVQPSTLAGVPVVVIEPRHPRAGAEGVAGFNIHGGGFMVGSARDRSALLMAGQMGVRVYSVEYTMAPEAKLPVAIEQCLAVYKALADRPDARRVFAVSSSSGGSIMLAMLLRAQKEGDRLPQAQVLFTPAADISGAGDSAVANDGRDVVSPAISMRLVRDFYLGGVDPKSPDASPLYGTYAPGFPASVILTGTRDVLESNGVRLFWKLRASGIPARLLVGEGMWHGFHWEYEMPESVAAMQEIVDFLDESLGLERRAGGGSLAK